MILNLHYRRLFFAPNQNLVFEPFYPRDKNFKQLSQYEKEAKINF
jgi:hypothetical protein